VRFATITCDLIDGPRNGQAIPIDNALPPTIEFTEMHRTGSDQYGTPMFTPASYFYELDTTCLHQRPRYRFLDSMTG